MLEDLVTLENLNSLLLLDDHFYDEYKINLGLLPSTEFSDYYYDFNIVDMNFDDSRYIKLFKDQNPAVSDEISINDAYCNDNEFTRDTFIQLSLKVENISTSKIGLYQEGIGISQLCSISSLNIENKKWVNVTIVKTGGSYYIAVDGEQLYYNDNLDGRKKYKFIIVPGRKSETIYIKDYQVIEIEGGELVKQGIIRDSSTGRITNCSQNFGTAQGECTIINDVDVRHIHGNGYFSINETNINIYDGNVYLYKFYLNTSTGNTDLSKVKLSISESNRTERVYGYDYKEWSFNDLFDSDSCATVYVMLFNRKIYIYDVEYGIKCIDTLPTVNNYVKLFIEISNTDLWLEDFNVYKFPKNTNFVEMMHPLNETSCNVEASRRNYVHYKIKVFNKLWTGEIKFSRLNYFSQTPIYWIEEDNLNYNNEPYIIHIIYDSDDFDVILVLDNDYTGNRKIFDNRPVEPEVEIPDIEELLLEDLKIVTDLNKEYSYSYFNRPTITFRCLDSSNAPIQDVFCVNNDIGCNGKTNANGEFSFIPPLIKPGTYYYNIILSKLNYETTYCKIKLIISKEDLQLSLIEDQAYWGGFCDDIFVVNANGTFQGELKIKISCPESNINQSVYKSMLYNTVENFYYIHFEQSYRKKRLNNSIINVKIEGNDYFNPLERNFTKNHQIKTLSSWAGLKNEINNLKGVDIVRMTPGHYPVNEMIQVRRDFEIQGALGGNDWATFENTGNRNTTPKYAFSIFPENGWITFNINSIKFWELNKCMFLNGYVNVNIDNCLFLGNSEELKQDLGVCVETNIGQTYINNNYGNLNITRSIFKNNKGSCIATSYNTNINTCKFILDDWRYAQHPQCYAIEIYGQNSNVRDCDFILSMQGRSPLPNYVHSNFSHGSAPLRIGKQGRINGMYGSTIAKDEYDIICRFGCTAYSYAKYKYDGVNVTLSPVRGKERCSYKYVVNGIDWAWHDNVRVNSYYDNTANRPNIITPATPDENLNINKFNERQRW